MTLGAFAVLCVAAAGALARPWLSAARVLAGTLGGGGSPLPTFAARAPHRIEESEEQLAGLRSRLHWPTGAEHPPHAVLLPGAHPLGIDEPRLRRFARALAGEGLAVHTPELPALRALQLDPAVVERIALVAVAARERAGDRPVAAFGISVTGGLLLRAALDPEATRSLSCVVAVGAHHDLTALAQAYARDATRPGHAALDSYGARVLVSTFADALLPAQDVERARAIVLDHVSERYARARAALPELTEQGRALVAPLLAEPRRVVPELMTTLLRARAAELAALSPAGALRSLRVPVFLLHGEHDPIVPSGETRALASEIPEAARARVLITPLLRHAEGSAAPATTDVLRLVRFMADVLATAQRGADR